VDVSIPRRIKGFFPHGVNPRIKLSGISSAGFCEVQFKISQIYPIKGNWTNLDKFFRSSRMTTMWAYGTTPQLPIVQSQHHHDYPTLKIC
jgi:hypothetical protein